MITPFARIFLAVLVAGLTGVSAWDAGLAHLRAQAPSDLPAIYASNAQLAVEQTETLIARPADFTARADRILGSARAALAEEPLDSVALRQVGLVEALKQANAGPAHWRLAERISRRDLANELLLIDAEARRGEVKATLDHYDRALLVHPASSQQLFPVLAKALPDSEILDGLAQYSGQPWFSDFFGRALEQGADPGSLLALLSKAWPHLHAEQQRKFAVTLIGQLVPRAEFGMMRSLARQVPGLDQVVTTGIGFTPATTDPGLAPLTWRLVNQDGIETAVDEKGGLTIRIASEQTGLVGERVTLLAPGDYDVTMDLEYMEGTPRAQLTWDVSCLGSRTPGQAWHHSSPAVSGATQFRESLTIPQGCEAQQWRLSGTAELSQAASVTRVARLAALKR